MSTKYGLKVAISFSREFGFNDGCSRSDYQELSKKNLDVHQNDPLVIFVRCCCCCLLWDMRAATSPPPPPLLRGLLLVQVRLKGGFALYR